MSERTTLHENIKRIRESRGVSVRKISKAAGMTDSKYENIESGEILPDIDEAYAIAAFLNTAIDELFYPVRKLKAVRFRGME